MQWIGTTGSWVRIYVLRNKVRGSNFLLIRGPWRLRDESARIKHHYRKNP